MFPKTLLLYYQLIPWIFSITFVGPGTQSSLSANARSSGRIISSCSLIAGTCDSEYTILLQSKYGNRKMDRENFSRRNEAPGVNGSHLLHAIFE